MKRIALDEWVADIEAEICAQRMVINYLIGTIQWMGGPTLEDTAANMKNLDLPQPSFDHVIEHIRRWADGLTEIEPRQFHVVDGGKG